MYTEKTNGITILEDLIKYLNFIPKYLKMKLQANPGSIKNQSL